MIDNLPFLVVALTIILGLYTILLKKDLIKIIMGISIIESGVNLFLIVLGYRWDSIAPIFTGGPSLKMVMPTGQALTLTSIVTGWQPLPHASPTYLPVHKTPMSARQQTAGVK
ncbi:MAG: NADH-quinone oxidoreductase subunit K [Burkholderiales bacterium]|nr:NADH-quinone oxidoreductase subunit K [Burkholderiales bacterium]